VPKRILEISSSGPDEFLQLIGGDPYGGSTSVGMRVPTLALPAVAGTQQNRYLFNGAAFSIGENGKARILGYRQLVTLGQANVGAGEGSTPRFVEQEVTSPFWRFQDGNVWMGLRQVGGPNAQGVPIQTPPPYPPLKGTSFRTGMAPSLLYEKLTTPVGDTQYVDLTAYVPPNAGRTWGHPVQSGNDWLSLQTQWRTHGAWHSMDLELEGPDTFMVFISVLQSDPSTRRPLAVPGTFFPGGLSAEEQFLLNYPNAIYWRVGCSLIVELT
jgi:hypothetical protein